MGLIVALDLTSGFATELELSGFCVTGQEQEHSAPANHLGFRLHQCHVHPSSKFVNVLCIKRSISGSVSLTFSKAKSSLYFNRSISV